MSTETNWQTTRPTIRERAKFMLNTDRLSDVKFVAAKNNGESESNVSVKSKLQHAPPPRANPGHLTPLPSRGGGNLIIRVFQGVGNLISMR